ncbi:MAG: hypothetical protein NTW21_44570 [Verrucomicrobia bacterium]|nr:hypothetical protein [Verrucomicrobiota bacterium]
MNYYLVPHVQASAPRTGRFRRDSAATPARLNFLRRLESLAIRQAARDYYVCWAEAWINPPNGLMSDDC